MKIFLEAGRSRRRQGRMKAGGKWGSQYEVGMTGRQEPLMEMGCQSILHLEQKKEIIELSPIGSLRSSLTELKPFIGAGRMEGRQREKETERISGFIVNSFLIMTTVVLFRGSVFKKVLHYWAVWKFGN